MDRVVAEVQLMGMRDGRPENEGCAQTLRALEHDWRLALFSKIATSPFDRLSPTVRAPLATETRAMP